MIAGVPTDSGSIVDLEKQKGDYLVAFGKAELVDETCEALTASTEPVVEPEPINSDEVDFFQMTKAQLATYGRSLGLELDKKQTKINLISKLQQFILTKEEF